MAEGVDSGIEIGQPQVEIPVSKGVKKPPVQAPEIKASNGNAPETIQETEVAPAAGMDLDDRYQAIFENIKKEWTKADPDFFKRGDDFDSVTLRLDAQRVFRQKYPEATRIYDGKEKVRIYEDYNSDPEMRRAINAINSLTRGDPQIRHANPANKEEYDRVLNDVRAREATQVWNRFVEEYPEKAKAYAEKGHPQIKMAYDMNKEIKDVSPGVGAPNDATG